MIDLLNSLILLLTIATLSIVFLYIVGSKTQFSAKLAERQVFSDTGCQLLTFVLPKNVKKLGLKIGQQILIKIGNDKMALGQGKRFTPIEDAVGVFKILITPTVGETMTNNANQQNQEQCKVNKQLEQLKLGEHVFVKIAKSNFTYLGDSTIQLINQSNIKLTKQFKNFFIIAQGSKIPIAYKLAKGICQSPSASASSASSVSCPQITILFIGSSASDFSLKKQLESLQQSHQNIQYFYSIPIKGQRQPSIGIGISSEKITQAFNSMKGQISDTFCVFCVEDQQISVAGERALTMRGVPDKFIYKY